jgi:DNA-binding NtrC family response regulator
MVDMHTSRGVTARGRPPTILIVDDEADVRDSLALLYSIEMPGVRVETAADGHDALERLAASPVDLIVTDYVMPGMDGIEFLRRATEVVPGTPRVMISAYGDLQLVIQALNQGHLDNFFSKPLKLQEVLDVSKALLRDRRASVHRTRALARGMRLLVQGSDASPS